MKDLFAKRLKNARKLAGLSQDDLVSAMDGFVKKTSIAKYERAEMMPDSRVVLALSRALGVLPEYFTREFNVGIERPEFRKKRSLGVKELERIEQDVMLTLESYIELEDIVGKNDVFDRKLTELLIHDEEDVELAAEQLLTEWNLGFYGVSHVFSVLEEHGIRLIEVTADKAFDGFSTFANGNIPVIVFNKDYPIERKRLTVLHELGHLLLNFSKEVAKEEKRIESMCFRFGAALMMPRICFFKELGKKRHHLPMHELILMKERYGLSVQAIVRRAHELEVITDYYYQSLQFILRPNSTEEGWGKYGVVEKPSRFDQLLVRSVAEELISIEKAAELTGMKSIDFIQKYQIA
jgi:Zn-dependent peptidase ImmA (M78 family)/DNA-binding XRE family transcriptional regulator